MNAVLLIVIAILTYLCFAYLRKVVYFLRMAIRAKYHLKDVPGPPSLPLIGSALFFKPDTRDFTYQLEDWARNYLVRQGDKKSPGMACAWVGPVPTVFLGTCESIRPILESNVNITKPTFYDKISDWVGTGLLTSTSEKWFTRRKMLTPTFHFNILQGYQDTFSKHGEILVDVLQKEADKEAFFDIFFFFKRCALDIICETAMGTELNAQTGNNNEYVAAVNRASAIIWEYLRRPWMWFPPIFYGAGDGFEFDRLAKLTNDFTRKVIVQRKQAFDEQLEEEGEEFNSSNKRKLAFLDMLIAMQKESKLSDEDIREEVDTFMFEGHDTTASAMSFTIWWLGQSPRCQKLVHDELDDIFGNSDRAPNAEDMKKMVYLEKCIKESLRLFPSVPLIARRLEQDVKIGETLLPEGLTVIVTPVATARDPRMYECPNDFYPEHFDSEKTSRRDPYAYIPFSAGPRNCIGQKFALSEEKIVLSWVLRKYNVESKECWPAGRPVPELILKPHNGIHVKLTRRD